MFELIISHSDTAESSTYTGLLLAETAQKQSQSLMLGTQPLILIFDVLKQMLDNVNRDTLDHVCNYLIIQVFRISK